MNDSPIPTSGRSSAGQAVPAPGQALLIAEDTRRVAYGDNHPLSIPRISLMLDLIRAYGVLEEGERVDPRIALDRELCWFHTPEYVAAMHRCEAMGKVRNVYRQRHNIGNFENPWFRNFFRIPARATGASVQGAELVIGGRMAFNPAGGMHHAMPDSAQGFCYFNDPALGIHRLRHEGWRVLYVDIDAHHGDGVEYAFQDDPEVMTVSLHMDTGYAYPFQGGAVTDWGVHGNAVNLPLPRGVHDAEYRHAFERVWGAALAAHRPDAVVVQAGTDMLLPDPLGKFGISNRLFLELIGRVLAEAPQHPDGTPRVLMLGGGGYHPFALARCWAGVWGKMTGREMPDAIPAAAQYVMRAVDWDMDEDEDYFEGLFTHRLDPIRDGEIRPEVETVTAQLLEQHPTLRSVA